MQLQYISDNLGNTTAVQLQIPIEEWKALKEKYAELGREEFTADDRLPEWQIELGRKEVARVNQGAADLTSWQAARTRFKL